MSKGDGKKLSQKYHRREAKLAEPFNQPPILSEDDPRIEEAVERMDRMELDLMYAKREDEREILEYMKGEMKESKYSVVDRLRAVMAYVTTGSSKRATEIVGIPEATIRTWKAQASWWPKAVEYAQVLTRESRVAKLEDIVNKAHEAVADRLDGGDYRLNKHGELVRVPVSVRDAMMVAAIAQDKQALAKGEPTSIVQDTTQNALDRVATKLLETMKRADPKVIEGVVVRDEGDGEG